MPALVLQPEYYFGILAFFVNLMFLIYGYINREKLFNTK